MDENLLQIVIRAVDQASATLKGVQRNIDAMDEAVKDADDGFKAISISADRGREILEKVAQQEADAGIHALKLSGDLRATGQALGALGRAADIFIGGQLGPMIAGALHLGQVFTNIGPAITILSTRAIPGLAAAFGLLNAALGPVGWLLAGVGALGALLVAFWPSADRATASLDALAPEADEAAAAIGNVNLALAETDTAAQNVVALKDGITQTFDAWGASQRKAFDEFLTGLDLAPEVTERATAAVGALDLLPKGIGFWLDEAGVVIDEKGAALGVSLEEKIAGLPEPLREMIQSAGGEAVRLLGVDAQAILEAGGTLREAILIAWEEASAEVKLQLVDLKVELDRAFGGVSMGSLRNALSPEGVEPGSRVIVKPPDPKFSVIDDDENDASGFTEGSLFDKPDAQVAGRAVTPQLVGGGGGDIFNNYGTVKVYVQQAGDVLQLVETLTGGA